MRIFFAILACFVALTTGCSSDTGTAATPTPTPPAATPGPAPTSSLTVSDAAPSLDELRDLGLGEKAAQCFIDTIDPDGTGTVQSADAFMQAWALCL